ncbi:hypothetical protein HMI54_005357 [Coelomomyces lativittatus]|nr:hypothetical protein HMI54_005357 [Coelomomyces lativittatus]
MKKYFQKHLQRLSTTSSSSLSSTTLISMKPWKDLTSLVYYLETQVRQLQTETQAWQVRWQSQGLESNPSMTFNSKPHQDWEGWKQSWTRDMDEKLYLMASEVRDLKSICSEKSLSHPTYMTQLSKLPKWSIVVWNTKTLKQGSAIVWTETGQGDSEVCQVDPEHPHLIKVPTEGIYFLSFAIFTSLKPSIQVVVNGQSIVSAIHSPTYTVHHENSSTSSSSKSKKGNTASSISWMDYVNIPSRSKLSLHWHGGKLDSKVHGFLYLQKMV